MKKAFAFTLKGKYAHFKKPEYNLLGKKNPGHIFLTFGQAHKPFLLGLFGSVLGINGRDNLFKIKSQKLSGKGAGDIEYYEKLKHLKVSVIPKPLFSVFGGGGKKTVRRGNESAFEIMPHNFLHSSGLATGKGQTLMLREYLLKDPEWLIIVASEEENDTLYDELRSRIIKKESVFLPYLGKNELFAEMEFISDAEDSDDAFLCYDSFGLSKDDYIEEEQIPYGLFCTKDDFYQDGIKIYREVLPYKLNKEGRYEYNLFYSVKKVDNCRLKVESVGKENLENFYFVKFETIETPEEGNSGYFPLYFF